MTLDPADCMQGDCSAPGVIDLEHHRRDEFVTIGDQRVIGIQLALDLLFAAFFDKQHLMHLMPHRVEILEIESRVGADFDAAQALDRRYVLSLLPPDPAVLGNGQDVRPYYPASRCDRHDVNSAIP
jgi:hypothetical protein